MLGLRVEKSIGVDSEGEMRGDDNDVVGGEAVMRRDGNDTMSHLRAQLLLSRHGTRNSGPSGCSEVNFSLF